MTRRAKIEAAVEAMQPALRKAFLDAIADIRSAAQIALVAGHLERGDVEAAIAALHLDAAFLAPLDDALRQAYVSGGNATLQMLTGLRDPRTSGPLVIRFDRGNPRPERWLREHSSKLIREITEEQRAGIREVLVEGMAAGRNPRSTALEIVGRLNGATGKREGGLIGLTSSQMKTATNAETELLSGDPAAMKNYLGRKLRDRRYDSRVLKAIEEGRRLNAVDAAQMVQRYRDRMLKMRGDFIARTESMAAFGASQWEAMHQIVDTGALQASQIRKVWRSAGDGRVRHSHQALNGTELAMDEAFRSPATGALMQYPGDTEHGAHGEDVIGCRCICEPKINYLAGIRLKAA